MADVTDEEHLGWALTAEGAIHAKKGVLQRGDKRSSHLNRVGRLRVGLVSGCIGWCQRACSWRGLPRASIVDSLANPKAHNRHPNNANPDVPAVVRLCHIDANEGVCKTKQ